MEMELKIDIDKKDKREFMERFTAFYRYFKPKVVSYDIRETRKGYHVRLIVDFPFRYSDVDIVFLQLLLGSDWKRELLNYFRVKNGIPKWNVLFNKKFRVKVENGKITIRRVSYEKNCSGDKDKGICK